MSNSNALQQHLVYVFRSSPYGTNLAQEGLDALLAGAVFGPKISVIFIGDGVFQLHANQQPSRGKSHQKMLQALALYDVERLFVHAQSLQERGLQVEQLNITATALDCADIHKLLQSAKHILSF